MATNSWMESMGFPSEAIDEYLRTGVIPAQYQQSTTGPSPVIGVDQRDTGGERTATGGTTTTQTAPTGGFNPADWPDPYESSATQYNTAINAANPGGENINLPFYEGTDPGGGYIRGVGQTLAPGRSVTAADAQRFIEEARAAGADDAYIKDFLARNPYDFSRLKNAWLDETTPMGDSNDPLTAGKPLSQYTGGGGTGGGGTGTGGGTGGGGGTGTGGGTGGGPSGEDALTALLNWLQTQRGASDKENAELRAILMKQLGELDDPVSLDDPGIREAVLANRAGLQRGTEAQRREIAERRAYDESGGVGSAGYQNDIDRSLQQAGESGAAFEGQIMFGEMQQRRQQLNSLLAQAMALGDAETARLIQTELATINSQLAQSNFYDTMGLNWAQLEQGGNQFLMNLLFGGGNLTV